MGYFNPILQFGIENFCKECELAGIDGLIIPDLPVDVFKENYQSLVQKTQTTQYVFNFSSNQ